MANDPYLEQAAWFNLHDLDRLDDDSLDLGLVTDGFTPKPAFSAFQRAAGAGRDPLRRRPRPGHPRGDASPRPPTARSTSRSLPIDIRATDDQGVNDIDLIVDGKQVPLKTVKSGNGASVKFEWGGAKELSYGPHTVVATAKDEAKNEGRAVAKVIHVGGGNYPYKVGTTFSLKVGKVRNGKVKVRGKISPKGTLSRLAHGRAYVYFSRFDTKNNRWKRYSRFSRDAKHAFSFSYKFNKRGAWRVTGSFKPKKGFKSSRSKARKLKVRAPVPRGAGLGVWPATRGGRRAALGCRPSDARNRRRPGRDPRVRVRCRRRGDDAPAHSVGLDGAGRRARAADRGRATPRSGCRAGRRRPRWCWPC